VVTLAKELDRMHGSHDYQDCKTMGELTTMHISRMLDIEPGDSIFENPF
jgi:hypothetical protein